VVIPKIGWGLSSSFVDAIRYFRSIKDQINSETICANARQFEYAVFFESWRRLAERVNISTGMSEELGKAKLVAGDENGSYVKAEATAI
jgi:hypothetical protein